MHLSGLAIQNRWPILMQDYGSYCPNDQVGSRSWDEYED